MQTLWKHSVLPHEQRGIIKKQRREVKIPWVPKVRGWCVALMMVSNWPHLYLPFWLLTHLKTILSGNISTVRYQNTSPFDIFLMFNLVKHLFSLIPASCNRTHISKILVCCISPWIFEHYWLKLDTKQVFIVCNIWWCGYRCWGRNNFYILFILIMWVHLFRESVSLLPGLIFFSVCL